MNKEEFKEAERILIAQARLNKDRFNKAFWDDSFVALYNLLDDIHLTDSLNHNNSKLVVMVLEHVLDMPEYSDKIEQVNDLINQIKEKTPPPEWATYNYNNEL